MSLLVGGELLLYGDVGDPWGFGDGFTPRDVALALAEHGPGPLTVRINSGGGIAADGVTIHSLLAQRGEVTTIVDGTAASAASIIVMAGGVRRMRAGATLMIHDLATITWGNAADHQHSAVVLDKLSEQYAAIYARVAAAEPESMRALMKAETWFTGAEAVAAGLATEADAAAAVTAAAFDYRLYAHAPAGLPQRARPTAAAVPPAPTKEAPMTTKTWVDKFFATADKSPVPLPKLNAIVTASETLEAAQAALIAEQAALAAAQTTPAAMVEPAPPAEPVAKDWTATFFASAEKTALPVADLNAIVAKSADLASAQAHLIDAMATKANAGKPGPGGRTDGLQPTASASAGFDAGRAKVLAMKGKKAA
ncbi:MAG: hypothetical protein B7Z40_13510 [Bosea sp. 12-68-7]|nr:MAG: hypothetical protein B7Z40_13510 [Bosea sp. 12-68-7]OYX01568.1 MAG: hypothetical protein B7Z14_05740 [Bosea sp. 32-68-6]